MNNKTLLALGFVSCVMSANAMAALNPDGQADNSASTATLNFNGKVTSSLCQLSTSDFEKTIQLGEISAAQLKAGSGRAPSQTFTVSLENCDPTVSNISYVIQDGNGSPAEGGVTSDYLTPLSDETSAKGVGVYITEPEGTPVKIGETKDYGVIKDDSDGALANQTISLAAYIGTSSGSADGGEVQPGFVNAVGVMTIKATAAAAAP